MRRSQTTELGRRNSCPDKAIKVLLLRPAVLSHIHRVSTVLFKGNQSANLAHSNPASQAKGQSQVTRHVPIEFGDWWVAYSTGVSMVEFIKTVYLDVDTGWSRLNG
jgi:hypothetical protein